MVLCIIKLLSDYVFISILSTEIDASSGSRYKRLLYLGSGLLAYDPAQKQHHPVSEKGPHGYRRHPLLFPLNNDKCDSLDRQWKGATMKTICCEGWKLYVLGFSGESIIIVSNFLSEHFVSLFLIGDLLIATENMSCSVS